MTPELHDLVTDVAARDLEELWIGLWCAACGRDFGVGEPREPAGFIGMRHLECLTRPEN